MKPSRESAKLSKLLEMKPCNSSPAHNGKTNIFTLTPMAAPRRIIRNLLMAMLTGSPCRYSATMMIVNVTKNVRNPYSYDFMVGQSFANVIMAPVQGRKSMFVRIMANHNS